VSKLGRLCTCVQDVEIDTTVDDVNGGVLARIWYVDVIMTGVTSADGRDVGKRFITRVRLAYLRILTDSSQ
jgi:hypothetical protein